MNRFSTPQVNTSLKPCIKKIYTKINCMVDIVICLFKSILAILIFSNANVVYFFTVAENGAVFLLRFVVVVVKRNAFSKYKFIF